MPSARTAVRRAARSGPAAALVVKHSETAVRPSTNGTSMIRPRHEVDGRWPRLIWPQIGVAKLDRNSAATLLAAARRRYRRPLSDRGHAEAVAKGAVEGHGAFLDFDTPQALAEARQG
jgi:hypothetical protein